MPPPAATATASATTANSLTRWTMSSRRLATLATAAMMTSAGSRRTHRDPRLVRHVLRRRQRLGRQHMAGRQGDIAGLAQQRDGGHCAWPWRAMVQAVSEHEIVVTGKGRDAVPGDVLVRKRQTGVPWLGKAAQQDREERRRCAVECGQRGERTMSMTRRRLADAQRGLVIPSLPMGGYGLRCGPSPAAASVLACKVAHPPHHVGGRRPAPLTQDPPQIVWRVRA